MGVGFHSVSSQQIRALAEGTTTAADLALLTSGEVSRCLAMLALAVRDATETRHPDAAVAVAAWRLLERVRSAAPGAFAEVIRYPAVGAWATMMSASNYGPDPPPSPGELALIAAAAAIRGNVTAALQLPHAATAGGVVHLPSLGTAILPEQPEVTLSHLDGGTEIRGRRSGVRLPRELDADTPDWMGLTTVRAHANNLPLTLVIDDAHPHRLPGKAPPAARLSPAVRAEWRRRVAGGWQILASGHARTAAEVTTILRSVVPLVTHGGDMRSVTSRQAFGTFGLSLPADDVQMALTLAHEVQHAKLSALMDLVPLVHQADSGTHYVPWRQNPRPLTALLQGLYAHVEIARFWQQHRTAGLGPAELWQANVEFAKWRRACTRVTDSVRGHPGLTYCGGFFVDGLINVLRTWQDDRIPVNAVVQADHELDNHQQEWGFRRPEATRD